MRRAKPEDSADAAAMLELARAYLEGNGVIQNFEKAMQLLKKSANLGHAEAQYEMADVLRAKGNPTEALHWDQLAAGQNWPKSQYNLGVCFRDGIGTPVNPERAFYWYRKAAENGVTEAKLSLAICCLLGNGTEQDFPKAIHWLKQASDDGNAEARMRLGVAYMEGIGCTMNKTRGRSLIREAAEMGNEKAKELMISKEVMDITSYEDMTEDQHAAFDSTLKRGRIIMTTIMAIGGLIGAVFGGAVGASPDVGSVFGGILLGAFAGIGIGPFLGYVKTEFIDFWSSLIYAVTSDEGREVFKSGFGMALFSLLLFYSCVALWKVVKLSVILFICPFIAIYRLNDEYDLIFRILYIGFGRIKNKKVDE